MKGFRIPGPAGDDGVFLIEEKNKADSTTFHSTVRLNSLSSGFGDASKLTFNGKRASVEDSKIQVLQISEGLLGEMLLTVKNGTSVTQISVTSRAKAMFASVLPGDTLCLDQINVIASHHNKPLSLVCVDSDGKPQNQKIDTVSVTGPKGTFADATLSKVFSDPSTCGDSETNESQREQKYSSSQGNDEKDEVDELLEGVGF